MKHLDLFSGIGGFSLAADTVFGNVEHTFVEIDPFCQEILKKHWPESEVHHDIRQFITDTESRESGEQTKRERRKDTGGGNSKVDILTGGFPCQPFSQAGKRKGTSDDRYLWPEMFRVIQLYQPQWVIAENVRGLTTWNEGMVLEQVCTDLESEGYEVQPLIIPACSVNASHRRERVWIIAHSLNSRQGRTQPEVARTSDSIPQKHRAQHSAAGELERTNSDRENDGLTTNSRSQRWERGSEDQSERTSNNDQRQGWPDWSRDWQEVAFATCNDGVDDRIPRKLGNTTISFARWRREALKAYGNAIVPQVAMEIMEAIKLDDKRLT